jgi:hypothetical protein
MTVCSGCRRPATPGESVSAATTSFVSAVYGGDATTRRVMLSEAGLEREPARPRPWSVWPCARRIPMSL